MHLVLVRCTPTGRRRARKWSADHKHNEMAGTTMLEQRSRLTGPTGPITGPRTTKNKTTGMTVLEQRCRLTGPIGPISGAQTAKSMKTLKNRIQAITAI
jgi:hypothetical protein